MSLRMILPSLYGATSVDLVCKSAAAVAIDVPKGAKYASVQADGSNDCNIRTGLTGVVSSATAMLVKSGSGLNIFEIGQGATKMIGYTAGADTTLKVWFG